MTDERQETERAAIDLGYPLGQLEKALAHAAARGGESAAARVERWRSVIAGMLGGLLNVGSRTPLANAPPWVTLEVVHGGFATGNLAAAGGLKAHEKLKLESLALPKAGSDRARLNLHYLGDDGRAELLELLKSGCFRVQVPEEGALLALAWLMGKNEFVRAQELADAILPFADRLRFYPIPHEHPFRSGDAVRVQTVKDAIFSLGKVKSKRAVAAMNEAINVWTPLYDRVVQLFLETVDGAIPEFRSNSAGKIVRRDDGHPLIDGGWPCYHYPSGWIGRANSWLEDFRAARTRHTHCHKVDRPKENFARLRDYVERCLKDPAALSGRDVGYLRKILASYVTRHGAPGSERHRAKRTMQRNLAAKPTHDLIAQALARRLDAFPKDEGLADLRAATAPISVSVPPPNRISVFPIVKAPSARSSPPELPIPDCLVEKATRCLEAPIETLVERRIITSSESLARVLPRLTAGVRAQTIGDPALQRLYAAVYVAFRRRRSLLLLNLENQVKLDELPWVTALSPWVGTDEASRRAARDTLVRVARLAIETFPHSIVPNKLVQEFRALSASAGAPIPFVNEIAADIFMGTFSETFLKSAQIAAQFLHDSLYERYYGISYDFIQNLDDVAESESSTPISPGFAALCEHRAIPSKPAKTSLFPRPATAKQSVPPISPIVRNGAIIEQAQILTTHNLAPLFFIRPLRDALEPKLPSLARAVFKWICWELQLERRHRKSELQTLKNAAYAWRQMLFFLSMLPPSGASEFVVWAEAHLGKQSAEFRNRFGPALVGFRIVLEGDEFDGRGMHAASGGRRFLAWAVDGHWLL